MDPSTIYCKWDSLELRRTVIGAPLGSLVGHLSALIAQELERPGVSGTQLFGSNASGQRP
jgi:hypothetical protein